MLTFVYILSDQSSMCMHLVNMVMLYYFAIHEAPAYHLLDDIVMVWAYPVSLVIR